MRPAGRGDFLHRPRLPGGRLISGGPVADLCGAVALLERAARLLVERRTDRLSHILPGELGDDDRQAVGEALDRISAVERMLRGSLLDSATTDNRPATKPQRRGGVR
jgi:hypothetical protein